MAKDYLGTDMALDETGDFFIAPNGDVDCRVGASCLTHDLRHRLMTPKGGLFCHTDYGVDIYQYLHRSDTVVNRLGLVEAIRTEIGADPRVEPDSVWVEVVNWQADGLTLRAGCQPREDSTPLSFVLNYGVTQITAEVVQGG